MAIITDPKFGFKYGWASGDDGWGNDMNTNLQLLMTLVSHLEVEDRDLTAPPGSPAVGDAYIVGASATGAWAGRDNDVAIWWQTPTGGSPTWLFIDMDAAKEGVRCYIKDEDRLAVWKGAAWSIGAELDKNEAFERLVAQPKVEDRNLTAPPGSPAIGDTYIPASTATGAWAGRENDIAVWWRTPGAAAPAWTFRTPDEGTLAYIKDEDVLAGFNGTSWSTGISL